MSLTIKIDRLEGGHFRAEVAEYPRLVIEHDELSGLVEEIKRKLDLIAVTADGSLWLFEVKSGAEKDETEARADVERTALGTEELDGLIDRYPVPSEWGEEPGWSDAL